MGFRKDPSRRAASHSIYGEPGQILNGIDGGQTLSAQKGSADKLGYDTKEHAIMLPRELSSNEPLAPQGHTYRNLTISGQARVHAGNQITINNYQAGVSTNASTKVGSAALGTVFLETLIQFLVLVQRLMATVPIQVQQPLVLFEDAHGRRSQIDINFVANWDVFEFGLLAAFSSVPGRERVIQNRYRLSDAYQKQVLFNPNSPPDFAATFRPGRKFYMSMHFEWYEVSTRDCPRCRYVQPCAPEIDTIW